MGPDPMTSTERRSSRLGMAFPRSAGPAPALCLSRPRAPRPPPLCARPLHQRAERVELPGGVMRARRGLRVVLDAERGRVEQPESLDHAVVEVDVADLGPAERRVEGREG